MDGWIDPYRRRRKDSSCEMVFRRWLLIGKSLILKNTVKRIVVVLVLVVVLLVVVVVVVFVVVLFVVAAVSPAVSLLYLRQESFKPSSILTKTSTLS